MPLYQIEAAHVNAEAAKLGFDSGIQPDRWSLIQETIVDIMDELQPALIKLALRFAFPEKASEIDKSLPSQLVLKFLS